MHRPRHHVVAAIYLSAVIGIFAVVMDGPVPPTFREPPPLIMKSGLRIVFVSSAMTEPAREKKEPFVILLPRNKVTAGEGRADLKAIEHLNFRGPTEELVY